MSTDRILLGTIRGTALLVLALLLAMPPAACFEMGDSDNGEETGWQERGRDPGTHDFERQWDPRTGEYTWVYDLEYTDIVLSPDGHRLLAMVPLPGPRKGWEEPGMVLVAQTIPSGRTEAFSELMNIERLNFSPDGRKAFVLKEGGREVAVLDLDEFEIVETYPLADAFSVIDISPDGRFLVLSNLPTTDLQELLFPGDCIPANWHELPEGADLCQMGVVDLDDGSYEHLVFEEPLRDLDFSPVSSELLLTWSPAPMHTAITFYNPASDFVVKELTVPNCADELVLQPGGKLALLAPTRCNEDPISILDLEKRIFVKNLPGFGPVAITPDGTRAVGFTRMNAMISEWGYDDQKAPFGLIVVELPSLDWRILDFGSNGPAYTLSPDGGFLYVDGKAWDTSLGSDFNEVDLSDLSIRPVEGGDAGLDRFVWTPSGKYLFTLTKGELHRVEVGKAEAVHVKVDSVPELINVRPQGDFLLLGEQDAPRFYLLGLQSTPEYHEIELCL